MLHTIYSLMRILIPALSVGRTVFFRLLLLLRPLQLRSLSRYVPPFRSRLFWHGSISHWRRSAPNPSLSDLTSGLAWGLGCRNTCTKSPSNLEAVGQGRSEIGRETPRAFHLRRNGARRREIDRARSVQNGTLRPDFKFHVCRKVVDEKPQSSDDLPVSVSQRTRAFSHPYYL